MVSEDKVMQPSPSLPQLHTLQTDRSEKTLRQSAQLSGIQNQELPLNSKQFFPIEVYDPLYGEEDYSALIDQYRDETTGKTFGMSRWQLKNSSTEFRHCEVVSFSAQEELFLIKWTSNGKTKKVARFNLIFTKED